MNARLTSPIFEMTEPDQRFPLYVGPLELEQGNYRGGGDGTIEMAWNPTPRIRFEIPTLSPVGFPRPDRCVFRIPGANADLPAHLTSVNTRMGKDGAGAGVQGTELRNPVIQTHDQASHALFHVVNFWDFINPRPDPAPADYDVDRVVFEGGGWRVTIQAATNLRTLRDQLKGDSGRAITHIGKVEKADGSSFTRVESHALFHALRLFLSFARGIWSPPILYIGFDVDGKRIWDDWTVHKASPWCNVLSWFPETKANCLADIFPGFMKLWQDPDWESILQIAIHWYVEANQCVGAMEGSHIFCQTALDMLAWYVLVVDRGRLREADFQPGGLSASERMRRLLSEFGIPAAIPSTAVRCVDLGRLALARNWRDAADALVELRNVIVHPERRNRQRLQNFPPDARRDAWMLSLWFVETILLKLFGYAGQYSNRLTARFTGETEAIP